MSTRPDVYTVLSKYQPTVYCITKRSCYMRLTYAAWALQQVDQLQVNLRAVTADGETKMLALAAGQLLFKQHARLSANAEGELLPQLLMSVD